MTVFLSKKMWCVICCLLIAGCSPRIKQSTAISNKSVKHNVILITVSSLRADHTGCLGYHRDTTPNFDAFAAENILFTKAFATASWQMPSVGSIFTSLYPSQHGATHINTKLGSEHSTLAEILKGNNFHTAGFCSNPRLSGDHGFGQGFDLYDDYTPSIALAAMSFGDDESVDINTQRTNDIINDTTIRWLQNNSSSPFFLFVHYYDTHWDYLPPSPYSELYDPGYKGSIDGTKISKEPLYSNKPSDEDTKHILALYDGEIRQTDEDIGELLDFLDKTGRFDDSIIIIMADHGEQFYEHGHTSHHGVFDELLHIPVAISVPGTDREARKIDSFLSGVDVMPTILDLLEISVPDNCQGKSMKPLIEQKADKIRTSIFAEYVGGAVPDARMARFETLKFVKEDDLLYAYDLVDDPEEYRKISRKNFTKQMETELDSTGNFFDKKPEDPLSHE